jgi:TATA-binding protein-associated factor
LNDKDDDVRAVAADTLLPVTSFAVKLSPGKISVIISTLWDTLLQLDDLSASTSSIMDLLAEIYEYEKDLPIEPLQKKQKR